MEDQVTDLQRKLREADTAKQALFQEFELKFGCLQEEHCRTAEASFSWQSKLEEEQFHSHLTLTQAENKTQHLQLQLDDAHIANKLLSEEVAAKTIIISTLQQRVQDLLTELSSMGNMHVTFVVLMRHGHSVYTLLLTCTCTRGLALTCAMVVQKSGTKPKLHRSAIPKPMHRRLSTKSLYANRKSAPMRCRW